MRLATYNVESLFNRPLVMSKQTWQEGEPILSAHSKFNTLIQTQTYTPAVKRKLLDLLVQLGILYTNNKGVLRLVTNPKYTILRENRGRLIKQPADSGKSVEIVATGRDNWVGWVDLRPGPVDALSITNTAQVIKDMNPDVIGIVEAENRKALVDFNGENIKLSPVGGVPYDHIMLIDGNDPRGIDVGIMTRKSFPIISIKSHVDDPNSVGGLMFSRDCPEYEIQTLRGNTLWLLINHLKSQGYRGSRDPDLIRREQATRVREIYQTLRAKGADYIAIIGDLNDSPDRGPLDPLLKDNSSDILDISQHRYFKSDGIPGTFGRGYATGKFDYILMSPKLFQQVKGGGVYRKGIWDDRKTPKWQMYDNMTVDQGHPERAASDHALVWADVDI